MGSEAGLDMFVVALLLLCCAFTAFYLERSKSSLVSESGVAMLLGMAVGGCFELRNADQAAAVAFKEEFFFYGLLPPIILEAGFSMKRRQFFSNFSTILLLAVVGTLIATFVIGSIISASGYLPSSEAFVYAALISAVDPVATLSVFKKVGAPEQLFNVVFGESVLNDAVAIVLFQIFDGMRPEHNGGSTEDSFDFTTGKKVEAVFKLLGIGVGSVVMAAATTLSTAYLLRRINARTGGALKHYPDLEISIVLLTTYLGYVLADLVELSGIVAIFFSGVMTSQYLAHNLSVAAQGALAHVLHMLAFLAENFVFIYLGLSVFTVSLEASQFEWNFGLIALSMVSILVARALSVFPLIALANCGRKRKIPWREQFVIWFAGLRGAIAFALALSYDGGSKGLIRATTMFTVVFTTLVLGMATAPLLNWLGLSEHAQQEVEPISEGWQEVASAGLLSHGGSSAAGAGGGTTSEHGEEPENPTLRGVHGWWRRFDENTMQPLFGGEKEARRELLAGDGAPLPPLPPQIPTQSSASSSLEQAASAAHDIDTAAL